MYLLFVPWVGGCGQWMKFPCGYGIYGMCEAGGSQPAPVQAVGWTGLQGSLIVPRSLGHQVAIPWRMRYTLEHCMEEPWWDLLVWGHLCWLAGGVDLHQAGPRNALRLTGATSRGREWEGECPGSRWRSWRQEGRDSFPSAVGRSSRSLGTSEEKK